MKNTSKKKIQLLAKGDHFVYIVARKLKKGKDLVSDKSCITNKDWGFSCVVNTLKKAEFALKKHIEVAKQFKEHETYGIITIKSDGGLELLKTVKT